MQDAIKRHARLGLLTLALAAGCGKAPPEVKLDPAMAGKPFPAVNSPADNVKPKTASFPGVNAAGDKKGP